MGCLWLKSQLVFLVSEESNAEEFFQDCSVNFGQASDLYRNLNIKIKHNVQDRNFSLSCACFSAKLRIIYCGPYCGAYILGIEHGQVPVDLILSLPRVLKFKIANKFMSLSLSFPEYREHMSFHMHKVNN